MTLRHLTRTLRWLLDAEDAVARVTGDTVRILSNSDTAALTNLISKQPVTSGYVQSILDTGRRAGPIGGFARGIFLGIFDPVHPGQLLAACWAGANIVPVTDDPDYGAYFGQALVALDEHFGSIFGPQPAVTGVWDALQHGRQTAREIRKNQPFMTITEHSSVLDNPNVRTATEADYNLVLPASVAMFTEELGYSPLADGSNGYRLRVRQLIAKGHTMIETDQQAVRFKADFGIVTSDAIQIQGVWLRPDARGQGRAAPAMASVVNRALKLVPVVSLYVNDYNTAAIRTYERVGFATVDRFATVLF